MVATSDYGLPGLSLTELASCSAHVHYNPTRFAAATLRLPKPATTLLIFSSGKIVATGGRSEEALILSVGMVAACLREVGLTPSMGEFRVQNIVSVINCQFGLHLDQIAINFAIADDCVTNYDAARFPGVILRRTIPGVGTIVFLMFVGGKVIMTGARHVDQIRPNYEWVFANVLWPNRMRDAHGWPVRNELSSDEYRRTCAMRRRGQQQRQQWHYTPEMEYGDVHQKLFETTTDLTQLVPERGDDGSIGLEQIWRTL